ncbi:nucleotidyltransferase domain-containing protein [Desulfobotulus sp. H1]|uniref:Nucleotidyltransferase domain-containing protein n=1 Tax=Desulfobotulus pelophilus TaxID=2823377 RepID=A0ABT3N4M2_9BACT|nr:nucleotidyltransferase domain-containing protein [Desulfobotulus pelophilus]MCW7752399.1 nucleotidyltransferase domain-containing protein [Desulfobotulus pelophilus]
MKENKLSILASASFSPTLHAESSPSRHQEKYMNLLKNIILSRINRKEVMVFLFGSRVSGRHGSRADVDIGFLSHGKLPASLLHGIRNAIEDSIIPLEVDLVDFTRTDTHFKNEAMKEIMIWNLPEHMNKNF